MEIFLGADHGGFTYKKKLLKDLSKQFTITDCGAHTFDATDDYVDYAAAVARAISKNALNRLGVLLCRSGQGMCIAANKFPRVRAITAWNVAAAKAGRRDDLANILCVPADYVSYEQAVRIISAWLKTATGSEPRFIRRAKKISNLEKLRKA